MGSSSLEQLCRDPQNTDAFLGKLSGTNFCRVYGGGQHPVGRSHAHEAIGNIRYNNWGYKYYADIPLLDQSSF
eukprot:5062825-Karenia_brevis.AAC.1